MQNPSDIDPADLNAMFQADFGETVVKICEAVRDVYGEGGARMLTDAIDEALAGR